MFGKRGDQVETVGSSSPDLTLLNKKVDALTNKIATSEKLNAQVFDFIANFEKKVKELIESNSPNPADYKLELQSMLEKSKGLKPSESFEDLITSKINESDESIRESLREALATLDGRIEDNVTNIKELEGGVDLSHLNQEIDEKIKKAVSGVKVEKLHKPLLTKKSDDNEDLRDRLDELDSAIRKLEKQEKPSINSDELQDSVLEAKEILKSLKSTKYASLETFETELTGRLNKALDNVHRTVDQTSTSLAKLKAKVSVLEHTGIKTSEPGEASLKLTFDKKLETLANQIDEMNSEIASQEYVSVLETELRDKIDGLTSRMRAIETFDKNMSDIPSIPDNFVAQVDAQRNDIRQLKQEYSLLSKRSATIGHLEPIQSQLKVLSKELDSVSYDFLRAIKGKPINVTNPKIDRELKRLKASLERISGNTDVRPLQEKILDLEKQISTIRKEVIKAATGKPITMQNPKVDKELLRLGKEIECVTSLREDIEKLKTLPKTPVIKQSPKEFVKTTEFETLRRKLENIDSRVTAVVKRAPKMSNTRDIMQIKEELATLKNGILSKKELKPITEQMALLEEKLVIANKKIIDTKEIGKLRRDFIGLTKRVATNANLSPLKHGLIEVNARLDGLYSGLSKGTNSDVPQLKKELKKMWQEIDTFIGNAVNVDQLNFIKKGFKDVTKRVDSFEEILRTMKRTKSLPSIKMRGAISKKEFGSKLNGLAKDSRILKDSTSAIKMMDGRIEILAEQVKNISKRTNNPNISNLKRKINRIEEEIKSYEGSTVSANQLNFMKTGIKEINKKVDSFAEIIKDMDKNIKVVPGTRGVNQQFSTIGAHIEGLNKRIEKTSKKAESFEEFQDYCLEQLKKTGKWIEYINRNMK